MSTLRTTGVVVRTDREGDRVRLDGVRCLERPTTPPAVRVIDGTRQLGRLKHAFLAVGPTLLIPAAVDRAEHWLDWWVSSWEPSYHEVHLSDPVPRQGV